MERETVLVELIFIICVPLLALPQWRTPGFDQAKSSRLLERILWTRLWTPFFPAVLALAALVGWALQEPDPADEAPGKLSFLAAIPFILILLRAIVRAAWAFRRKPSTLGATVRGIFHPELEISPRLAGALDRDALRAVKEHESAHMRHRDPLRIWLAQLAGDLRWPWPGGDTRMRAWLRALELARDEEARDHGIDGADLATAVLTAARLNGSRHESTAAALIGDQQYLRERISRLLQPLPPVSPRRHRSWARGLFAAASLLVALTLGMFFGETAVRALPGVVSMAVHGRVGSIRH